MKRTQKIVITVAALGLLAAAGCEKPYDYTMQRTRIFLMGRLLVGKTCDVRVIWRKAPDDPQPATVTADLREIGGPAEQELVPDDNSTGIWRWMGQVTPVSSGEKAIIVTASDSEGRKKQESKGIPVFAAGKAVAIAAGYHHRLAVMDDGTLTAWGCEELHPADNLGQCDVPSEVAGAVAAVGGWGHSMVLFADGTVAAWGQYYSTESDNDSVITPMEVPEGIADIVAIAASHGHNLALKADGTVVAWGDNDYGQCDVPPDLTDVIAVSTGYDTSYAVRGDGAVVSWGVKDAVDETIKAIAVSPGFCVLVLNESGHASLYRSASDDCFDVPVRANRGFKAIAAYGEAASGGMGLQKDGTVVSWVNKNSNVTYSYVNVGPENVLAIAAGGYNDFRLAVAEDGTVTDWIDDWYGHQNNAVPDAVN
jgi:hypothetical protein